MELSVAIAGDKAPPSAFVVWRGFASSIKKAKRLGYHGVELALRSPEEVGTAELARCLTLDAMKVSAVSTGQVFAVDGLSFTDRDPSVREATFRRFTEFVDFAVDFGGKVNIGRVRGVYTPGVPKEVVEKWFVQATIELADYAAARDVEILIEPINRYESDFINSVDDGARILSQIAHPACGLMPDVFHMNIEDAHIDESFLQHSSSVKYVHFADSNRRAPGDGHLDFDMVFGALSESGFDGWTAVEILPLPDPDTAARNAAEFLLPRVAAYEVSRVRTR